MKYTEIIEKDIKELQNLLKEKKMLLFKLRNKLRNMQLTNPNEIREVRKDIARINTAISAKQRSNG